MFSILLFGIIVLLIPVSSFHMVNAQEYHNYNDNAKNLEIERFDDKLFVCDNGIVVDDRTQCPIKCTFGTTLEGAYVMDLDICDIEPGTAAKKCPNETDLEGVLVMNKNQCEIFAECDADSPLGLSLGGLEPIKVADVQLCQLSAPNLEVCDSGFFEGFAVDNQQTCNTVFDNVDVCGPTTDLAGMLTADTNSCNIFETCSANSNLGIALGNTPVDVADPELCNLEIPEQTELFICDLDTPMGGAIVTDEKLCQAPNDNNKCPAETDLEGVYVMDIDSDCNIFATCDAGTPLGIALGMENEFKVADEALCNLEIPEQIDLFQCIGGPMIDAIVTDAQLCQAPNDANKCADDTDLLGVYVMDVLSDCNIFATCDAGTPLGIALGMENEFKVADEALCNLEIPEQIDLFQCIGGPMIDAIVTDAQLCQAPNDANKCADDTDLLGVYVMDTETQCDLDIPETIECPEGTLLVGEVVTSETLCNVSETIECPDSGFLVNDEANCPQKCDDGTYLMQGMQCPIIELNITKNWFVCDNTDIDCTTSTFNKKSTEPTFETPTSNSYVQCISEQDCPFTSDANLEIEVSGNNPMPTNIDALVGTMQDVNIDNGPYSVSEMLEGQQEPFISKFDRLDVGNRPQDAAYAQDKMLMYVTNAIDDTVTILDTAGGADNTVGNADDVLGTVAVGNFPQGVAYAQDKMLMYVTNPGDNTVTILDTAGGADNTVGTPDDVLGTVAAGNRPQGVAYAQDKMLMYVTNSIDDTVTILDTAGGADNTVGTPDDVLGTVAVGDSPLGVAYAQDKMLMYVTNVLDNTVTILDTAGGADNTVGTPDDVLGTVAVGDSPRNVAYAQDKMLMYVTNALDNTVTILDTAGGADNTVGTPDDVVGTVNVGNSPQGIAYAQDKMLMYVTNPGDNTVTILDTAGGADSTVGTPDDVVGTVNVGNSPQGIAYAQDKMLMYVTNSDDNTVSIISIPTIEQACQNSGFDTGDIRTYQSNGQTLEQITCVNFSEQCTGEILEGNTETQQCVIDDYVVLANVLP